MQMNALSTDTVLTDEQVCAILLATDPFLAPPPPRVTVDVDRLRRMQLPSGDEVAAAFDAIVRPQCPRAASAERARAWLEWATSPDEPEPERPSGVWRVGEPRTASHKSASSASIRL